MNPATLRHRASLRTGHDFHVACDSPMEARSRSQRSAVMAALRTGHDFHVVALAACSSPLPRDGPR